MRVVAVCAIVIFVAWVSEQALDRPAPRLAEWDRMNTVLAAVLPALREQMEPAPSREAGL